MSVAPRSPSIRLSGKRPYRVSGPWFMKAALFVHRLIEGVHVSRAVHEPNRGQCRGENRLARGSMNGSEPGE
jgi:hypothetical protein